MEVTKKKLYKEIFVWIVLIVITFIATTIYNNNKPETKIYNAYDKVYHYVFEAKDLENKDITKVQGILDLGRIEIKTVKETYKLDSDMDSDFNTLSTELDKSQEKIISVAKEKITELQILKKDGSTDVDKKKAEIEAIITSLENGNSKRAKSAAENLKNILNQ